MVIGIRVSSTIGHSSVELTIDTYSHVTDNMRYAAADKIDTTIGRNKGKQGSTKRTEESEERPEKFEAYKGKKRKPGTGYVKQVSANSWQGRYTPTIDGKRVSINIYAPTEEECERKLAEKIAEIKEVPIEEVAKQTYKNAFIILSYQHKTKCQQEN